jgi:hypothetical protein
MPVKKKKIVEKVIAFEGEQDFILNPNKPEYISAGEVLYVEAVGGQVIDVPKDGTPSGGEVAPAYLIPDWNSMDCTTLNSAIASLTSYISTNSVNLPPTEVTYYQSELAKAKTIYKQKCTAIGTVDQPSDQPTYPKFTVPVWSNLTCDAIKTKVAELKKFIADYDAKFITMDRLYYESALANGLDEQNRKCAVPPPATPPSPAPTVVTPPPFFFGGGGGGRGLGVAPDEGTKVETKKGGFPYLLLIALGVGVYLFTRKKG